MPNPWIQKIKECAKEYQEEKKSKSSNTKSKTKTKSKPKASNTKEKSTKSKSEPDNKNKKIIQADTFDELKKIDEIPMGLTKRDYTTLFKAAKRYLDLLREFKGKRVSIDVRNNSKNAFNQVRNKLQKIRDPFQQQNINTLFNDAVKSIK